MSKTEEAPWPATLPEKLLYCVCYVLSRSLLALPRRLQLWLGDVLGEIALIFAGYRKTVVLNNIAIAFPEMPEGERYRLMHRHFRHLGRLIIEYILILSVNERFVKKWFEVENAQCFHEVLEKGKGGLVLASHMGACDFGIVLASLAGFPFVLIGKRTRIRWVTRLLFGMRQVQGVEALPEERVISDVFRSLKKNKLVIFVMDQFMGPPQGIATNFFGRETGTAQGLAVFAKKTEIPVVPGWTYRLPNGKIRLVVEKPLEIAGLDHTQMTQVFCDNIENSVRRVPEQWFWVHKRWKKFAAVRTD